MVSALFFNVFVGTVEFIAGLVPLDAFLDGGALRGWLTGTITLIVNTAQFLPWDVIVLAIGNILWWLHIQFTLAVVRALWDYLPFT